MLLRLGGASAGSIPEEEERGFDVLG